MELTPASSSPELIPTEHDSLRDTMRLVLLAQCWEQEQGELQGRR